MLFRIKKMVRVFTDLKFAIFVLSLIALFSSIGSIIEQDEPLEFYEENYPATKPLFGFFTSTWIQFFGLDHIYTVWWFFLLLVILGVCLISCTVSRQFPLYVNSKDSFFQQQQTSFLKLPFFVRFPNISYLKEIALIKLQEKDFYLYQKGDVIYGYQGLIGRISPILVHLSLLTILAGSFLGAFQNFKAQEILPKGEIFHIQNPIRIGFLTSLPTMTLRVNDFWVEYEKNRIHQFYSNISILDPLGEEKKQQTISVNNPLRYQQIDIYQSDWNLLGIRIENRETKKISQVPLFSLQKNTKSWVTWIPGDEKNQVFTLIFDQFENIFFVYDEKGVFLKRSSIGEWVTEKTKVLEILPATGLLIKYDPSIGIIYFGFGLLMITACLSYLPYTQMWLFAEEEKFWVGCSTNRGKIQLEIEFENLLRFLEKKLLPFSSLTLFHSKRKNLFFSYKTQP